MIAHSSSSLGDLEASAVLRCVQQNYIGRGPAANALEAEISAATKRTHAFSVSSGFHALGLALTALDLPPGSPIAIPVLTCASIPSAIVRAGHRPVCCDIESGFLTLDPRAVPGECRAIVAPHAYGNPVDVAKLRELEIPWIEDCATAPASTVDGVACGAFGDLAIFSFNSTKYLTGGSGGAVTMNDGRYAARINALLGTDASISSDLWKHPAPECWPGWMSDLNASLALAQWKRLGEFRRSRCEIAAFYREKLELRERIGAPLPAREGHSYYRFLMRTTSPAEEMASALRKRGVDARSQVNPWLDFRLGQPGPFPAADSIRRNLLSLPIHPNMQSEDAAKVIAALDDLS